MKFKELIYMFGIKPKIKTFDFDIIDIKYGDNQTFKWALWRNPKAKILPRISDYDVLKLFLRPGDFAIDLGAHVGDTTISMGLCVGKKGMVLALEPNPATYNILKKNAQLNQELTNIVPMNVAAMDVDGDYIFQYNEPSLMNGGYQKNISRFRHASFYKIDVKGVNLSKLLREDFSTRIKDLKFFKTDLEGGDYIAFQSIKDIIIEKMPVIQSEINGVMLKSVRNKYIQELKELNYHVLSLSGETLENIQGLTQEMINSKETFDILAIPPKYMKIFS